MFIKPQTSKLSQPIVFQTVTGEQLGTFTARRCICKACRSPNMRFEKYLEDAKCEECGQWQNEDLTPVNH